MSGLQGGNFGNVFAAGAIASATSSLWAGGTNHDGLGASGKQMTHYGGYEGFGNFLGAEGVGGIIAFGTIAAGADAALTGGNFWQGAVTGLVVSGLNHAMDHGDGPKPKPKKAPNLKKANSFYNKNRSLNTIYDVAASSVDLNFVNTNGWIPDNVYPVQTLIKSEHGRVFGKLNLLYKGNNQVKILNDRYDFNFMLGNPPSVSGLFTARNLFTAAGDIYAGYGVSFTFKFHGLNTIKNNYNQPTSNYKQYP